MSKLKRSSVFIIVEMGLLATSAIAMAGHNDSHAEDTQFSFGYDEAETNHILSLNIGPNWEPDVCDFENGPLTATYDHRNTVHGIIPITELEDSLGDPWEFDPRPEEDLRVPADYAGSDSVPYGTEGVCGLSGVVVEGPNGQINHGQFIKAAKSLFDIKGQGCIVRYLAQSEVGRTDATRLAVPDVPELLPPGSTGEVFFSEAFEADCERGKKNGNVEAESTRGGRPDSPGKSGEAHDKKP